MQRFFALLEYETVTLKFTARDAYSTCAVISKPGAFWGNFTHKK